MGSHAYFVRSCISIGSTQVCIYIYQAVTGLFCNRQRTRPVRNAAVNERTKPPSRTILVIS